MEILEIIVLVVAWVFTLSWMYGVRIKPVIVFTSLASLTILLATLFFTFVETSKYHLLWVIPLAVLSSRFYAFVIINIPILNTVVITIGKLYTEILRIGMSKETRNQLYKEYRVDTKNKLEQALEDKVKQNDYKRTNKN